MNDSELEARPRGALLGIPGAPSDIPDARAADSATPSWTLCDRLDSGGGTASSAIVVGAPVFASGADRLKPDDAFLWAASDGTYLVQNGSRARVDLNDRGVVRALGLEGAQPVPVTVGLLESVPVSPAIVSPRIDGVGSTPPFSVGGKTVGSVFSVSRRPTDQHYVVLTDGIQPITEATALLIEFADSQGTSEIPLMTPDVLKDAPEVQNELAVSTYPERAPHIVDVRSNPVMCQTWQSIPGAQGGPTASLVLSTGRNLPIEKTSVPVALAQADGAGPAVDEVYSKPGSAEFVQSTDIGPSSMRVDSLFFVADTGVRYGVDGTGAGEALGLGSPAPAPWQIIRLLGNGPTLGRGHASTAHDGVAPDPSAALPVN